MDKRRTAVVALAMILVFGVGGGASQCHEGTSGGTAKTDKESRRHKKPKSKRTNRPRIEGTPAVECVRVGHNPAGKPVCLKWSNR